MDPGRPRTLRRLARTTRRRHRGAAGRRLANGGWNVGPWTRQRHASDGARTRLRRRQCSRRRRRPWRNRGCWLLDRLAASLSCSRCGGRRTLLGRLREDGARAGSVRRRRALARLGRAAASLALMVLHQSEKDVVGLLDGERGVDPVREGLHGLAGRGRPDAVEVAAIAAQRASARAAGRAPARPGRAACGQPSAFRWQAPARTAIRQRDDDGSRERPGGGPAARLVAARTDSRRHRRARALGHRVTCTVATMLALSAEPGLRGACSASEPMASKDDATPIPANIKRTPTVLLMVRSYTPANASQASTAIHKPQPLHKRNPAQSRPVCDSAATRPRHHSKRAQWLSVPSRARASPSRRRAGCRRRRTSCRSGRCRNCVRTRWWRAAWPRRA